MKSVLLSIVLLYLTNMICVAQDNRETEEGYRQKINTEFRKNVVNCKSNLTEKAISNINGETEFWKICKLRNGNRMITIEWYREPVFYQEVYFERAGELIYASETENYAPINSFEETRWNCSFYMEEGQLVAYISLGHGKTEDDTWNPESIFSIYHQRMLELRKLR